MLERRREEPARCNSHAHAGVEALHGVGSVANSLQALGCASNEELAGRRRVNALPARHRINGERLAAKAASR